MAKKKMTSRKVQIKSIDMVSCILEDEKAAYPVIVSIASKGGGASYEVYNKDELLDVMKSGMLKSCTVTGVSKHNNKTYVDLRMKGNFEILDNQYLPDIADGDKLDIDTIKTIYKDFVIFKNSWH